MSKTKAEKKRFINCIPKDNIRIHKTGKVEEILYQLPYFILNAESMVVKQHGAIERAGLGPFRHYSSARQDMI